MGTVQGRIGGALGGFDLRASVEEQRITGRIGGLLRGSSGGQGGR